MTDMKQNNAEYEAEVARLESELAKVRKEEGRINSLLEREKGMSFLSKDSPLREKMAQPDTPIEENHKPLICEPVSLNRPGNESHTQVALPLVRNWLFAPERTSQRTRQFENNITHKGKPVTQTLTIGDTAAAEGKGYGVLTESHQKVIFALQKLWLEQGGKVVRVEGILHGTVKASSHTLEKAMFGSFGGKNRKKIRSRIQELNSIPVKITNYVGPDGELYNLDISGLIGGAVFGEKKSDPKQLAFPWVSLLLSAPITAAFLAEKIKLLDTSTLSELSGKAAVLYPKIDYYLSTHRQTEMRLLDLAEKIGLTHNKQYMRQKNYRRIKFEEVIEQLDARPLSKEGHLLGVWLEETKDGQDFKLVARRFLIEGCS